MSAASLFDSWILSRLQRTIETVNKAFAVYDFSAATTAMYQFVLDQFCGIYLEVTKPIFSAEEDSRAPFARRVLFVVLDQVLRLLHPTMPFVTEELWQRLPGRKAEESVMMAAYPLVEGRLLDEVAEKEV
jgi:valyl-tRNA synthetase